MPDELELINLGEKKELLEKELKELNELKAQILKSKKESEKTNELADLNQKIARLEKELLVVKLQELKALKAQIVLPEKDPKKLEKKLSSFEKLLSSLEDKIDSLDAENEKAFENQIKEPVGNALFPTSKLNYLPHFLILKIPMCQQCEDDHGLSLGRCLGCIRHL